MGKKSGPPPPDYTAAAEKTAASNEAATTSQTWANRPSQQDPWGRVSWDTEKVIDPATGRPVTQWTQRTELDPRLQQALNSQIAVQQGRSDIAESMLGRARNEFGQAMDWSQLGPMEQGTQAMMTGTTTGAQFDPNAATGQAANAAYSAQTSRLDPQWQQRQREMETQLANQGISRNSEAYSRAMADMERQRTDAYQQANWQAQQAGATEAQRMQQMRLGQEQQAFGQGLQSNAQNFQQANTYSDYQNKLRQQQLNEIMQQRAFSLNEMNALLSGQQVNSPQFQGFNQAGNWGGVDYSGAAQNQFSAAQQQQQNKNASTGQALGGIASMAMMFSDLATKVLIERIGEHRRGFGLWLFRYVGESVPRYGVIAQEVLQVMPEAVTEQRGVLMVDYARIKE